MDDLATRANHCDAIERYARCLCGFFGRRKTRRMCDNEARLRQRQRMGEFLCRVCRICGTAKSTKLEQWQGRFGWTYASTPPNLCTALFHVNLHV